MKKFLSTAIAVAMMLTSITGVTASAYADELLPMEEDAVYSEMSDAGEENPEADLIYGPDETVAVLSRNEIKYVGTVQRPTVQVYGADGQALTYKKDFTVDYSDWNSTDAGEYTVTVNYIGDYYGSADYTYKIVPVSDVTPKLNRTVIQYNNTVQRPTVTVTDSRGRSLIYKKDFTVSYSNWNSTEIGTYEVTVHMIGNYSGSMTYEYFITSGVATLSRTNITYVGTVQRPTVTVKDSRGNQLTYKKDFTVDYSDWNSTNVGAYTVTVNYIGKYSGKVTYTYYITPQSNVTPKLNRTVITKNGTVQRPTVTVTDSRGKNLVYKTDFTVAYSDWNSKDEGVYTVTVNMCGNYSGSKTYKYYIDDKNSLPLNATATHISYEYANVTKEIFGKTYQGRNLEAFIITPANGSYTKTFFMTFTVHGFEDSYSRDGKLLADEGNLLVKYYAENPDMLKSFRLVIVPCVNADGTTAGVNNLRACSTAFGRCTANHVDINRDFGTFAAIETRSLANLLNKYRPDVFTDFHGWFDEVLGTNELCDIYRRNMRLTTKKVDAYGSTQGYLNGYVRTTFGCPSVLVEYKSPNALSHAQTYTSINEIINYYSK